ncbi:hypothetical protein [Demetria terragena]|uniref:hypothetical protein n=1 Tax=Demetria terragena TaxID=63959 RepID=UPI00036CE97D|nr:hypothetical protein [Demetria terragena]
MNEPTRAEQATAALRRTDEPGWDQLSERLSDTLRSTVLPAATVRADHGHHSEHAERPAQDLVSTRVLKALLRTGLVTDFYCPQAISLENDGDQLTAVDIELAVVYGVILPEVLSAALTRTTEILVDAVGAASAAVEVHVRGVEVLREPDWLS